MKDFVLKRLETALRVWEQTLFVANAETRVLRPDDCTGAIKNWHRLRRAVLDRRTPVKHEDFQVPTRLFPSYFTQNVMYDFLPVMFAAWARTSRRVYALTPDMQTDLELTSVAKVSWHDLHPPFPCFAITLADPIPSMHNNQIDTLMVEMKQKGIIRVTALGTELDLFRPMPKHMRDGIASAARHENMSKLIARCKEARDGNYCYIPASRYFERICGSNHWHHEIIADTVDLNEVIYVGQGPDSDSIKQSEMAFWLPICRIVIGLCLHLDRLQDQNLTEPPIRLDVDTPGIPVTDDPHAVTTVEELFTVHCGHPLTDEERRIHKIIRTVGSVQALRELGAHFRSAHWRRPPNTADDPASRKTVKVRWTIVNEDRLPEHGLASGSVVTVG